MSDKPITDLVSSFLNFDFQKAREEREANARAKKAEDLQIFLAGPTLPSNIPCMYVGGCTETRWRVPTTESVLCRDHAIEVLEGRAKAPPLRRGFDYQYVPRKTFLVETLPEFPSIDTSPDTEEPK